MTSELDVLSKFRDAFLDYLEGDRDEPPAVEELPQEHRGAAEAFIRSITAARGVDPYASRPSIEQLLAWQSQTNERINELGEMIQRHLRLRVDSGSSVRPDAASAAAGLASVSVIQALGMRMRVVPELNSTDLDYALTRRSEDIAGVFSAFPDSHAVLYTTTGQRPLAVVVDRGDVQEAIETPSGEMRAPRRRRSIVDPATACEVWLRGLIPEFQPLSIAQRGPSTAPEAALDPYGLASRAVLEVSAAGTRARIEAKQVTWKNFGDQEIRQLAAIVREAQLGQMSEEGYRSHLDELVGVAA
ncbi:MAG: hypothetical protein OXF50_24235 [Caldilineaceae bacterium]|nr:hypothetical protein [Caldilineaceae bacterium]